MSYDESDIQLTPGQLITDNGITSTSSFVGLGDIAFLMGRVLPRMVIDGLQIQVIATPGSAGSVTRLGLIGVASPTQPIPQSLIVDAGTVDTTTVGLKTKDIPPFIWPGGPLFTVAVAQGGPVTQPTIVSSLSVDIPPIGVFTALGTKFFALAGVAAGLPASFAGATLIGGFAPIVAIRAGDIKNVRPA